MIVRCFVCTVYCASIFLVYGGFSCFAEFYFCALSEKLFFLMTCLFALAFSDSLHIRFSVIAVPYAGLFLVFFP